MLNDIIATNFYVHIFYYLTPSSKEALSISKSEKRGF